MGRGGYQALGRGGAPARLRTDMGRGGSAVRTWVARSYAWTRARGGGQRKSPCEARSGTVSAVPEDTGGELSRRSVRSSQGHTPGAPGPLILTPERGEGKGRCGPEAGAARCPGGAPEICLSWPKAAPGPAGARPARRPPGARGARPAPPRCARRAESAPGSAWGKGFPEPSGARILGAGGRRGAPGGAGGRPCPRRPPAGRQLPGEAQGRRPFGGPPGAPGVHRGDSARLSGTSAAAAPVRGGRMGRRCGAGAAAPRAPPPDGTAAGRGGWNASCSPGFVAPGRVCPRRQEKFLE